jgi:nitrite reductase/ring-hydroxylating ferredoxin subunit
MIDVGPLAAFPERAIRIVAVDGVEVGVVRWDGEVFALRNVCPHEGAPVCRGRLGPQIVAGGAPGQLAVDQTRPVLACCWHGWEFDVRTGRAVWGKPGYTVRTYPVEVVGDRICIDIDAAGDNRRRAAERRQKENQHA